MFSLNDYETESKRLQVLNQKYAFYLNAMQYIKLRQAGAPGDLKFEIMEKKVTSALEAMINAEVPALTDTTTPKPATPLTVL